MINDEVFVLSKYKICPACGTENDPRNMECVTCSYDLMSTPIIDSDNAKNQNLQNGPTEMDNQTQEVIVELVRICSCGKMNPPQLRKCQRCHEDISDVIPVPKPAEENIVRYQFEQIDSNYIYSVPCGTVIIGREHNMKECLANKSYVSRIHAKLVVDNGKLYIENLSKTNYTYVNNEKIAEGQTELKVGDEIGFGGMTINGNRQKQAAFFIVGKLP